MTIPEFLWALLLLLVLGVWINVFPFIGRIDPAHHAQEVTGFLLVDALIAGNLKSFASAVSHLVLPVTALALSFSPAIMRVLRSSLLSVENEDYIRQARLRGLGESRILLNHTARNAILPTLSLIGVQAGFMFGGTLLVEVIFAWPGIGNLMLASIRNQDLPMIQGIVMTYCLIVLLLNFLVDASYLALNPKLRKS